MIIQIRGTSGSGKTWAMKETMRLLGEWEPVYRAGRKRPLYYRLRSRPSVVVLGHYETDCGGCDTIGSARAVYELIGSLPGGVEHVLSEGLLLSEDVKWSLRMPDLRVLFLITPPGRCLAQVLTRREGAGNDRPLNSANTLNRVKTIERARVKLLGAGRYVRRGSAAQVAGFVLRWLGETEHVGNS